MSIHNILFLLALLMPLSIDAFVLSTAIGLAGLPKKEHLRVSLVLALFEAGMPAVGVLVGHELGNVIGHYSNYIAAGVIGLVGILMIWPDRNEASDSKQRKLLQKTSGWNLIGLGVSISIDELAIGLSLGLLHVSLIFVMAYIAVQAFAAAQLGLWLGGRLSSKFRERAEQFGGLILVIVAIIFVLARLNGTQL